jgi:hypothetical protein
MIKFSLKENSLGSLGKCESAMADSHFSSLPSVKISKRIFSGMIYSVLGPIITGLPIVISSFVTVFAFTSSTLSTPSGEV